MNTERVYSEEDRDLLLEYRDNILYFNGINLEKFLKKHKTPIFLFSQDILIRQYNKIREAFSDIKAKSVVTAFSVKSNPLPEVAQTFSKNGSYFEVTSKGELKHVIENGGDPKKIIFTNIVKKTSTITFAIEKGVALFACAA